MRITLVLILLFLNLSYATASPEAFLKSNNCSFSERINDDSSTYTAVTEKHIKKGKIMVRGRYGLNNRMSINVVYLGKDSEERSTYKLKMNVWEGFRSSESPQLIVTVVSGQSFKVEIPLDYKLNIDNVNDGIAFVCN